MSKPRWINWVSAAAIALAVAAWIGGWWWFSGWLVERYLRGAGGPIR